MKHPKFNDLAKKTQQFTILIMISKLSSLFSWPSIHFKSDKAIDHDSHAFTALLKEIASRFTSARFKTSTAKCSGV